MRIETDRENHPNLNRLSRRQFIKLTGAAAAGLLVGCRAAQEEKPTLALINGTLIDGTGARAQPDAVVLIKGGRILSAGARVQVKIPAQAKIIDVQGGALLPRFINAYDPAADNEVMLKTWASEGVTTVRDLGAHAGVVAGCGARLPGGLWPDGGQEPAPLYALPAISEPPPEGIDGV